MSEERQLDEEGNSILHAIMNGDVAEIRDARLNQIISNIADWASRPWTLEDAPSLVVYEVIELAYSYPKRAEDLIDGIRTLMKSGSVVPAVILARALVETVAMGRYFIDRIEKCLSDADFPKFEVQFFRFYAGSKLANARIKSVHVNDALRDLEAIDSAYVANLFSKYPFLASMSGPDPAEAFKNTSLLHTYDKLSEISHPNGLGTQYLYPAADAPDNSDVIAFYRCMTGTAIWQAHHLLAALGRRLIMAQPEAH